MIKTVMVTTAHPTSPDDPGRCERGFYKVVDDSVVLCNEDGFALGARTTIGGDDEYLVAQRLLKKAWLSKSGESNFNRPLGVVPRGIA